MKTKARRLIAAIALAICTIGGAIISDTGVAHADPQQWFVLGNLQGGSCYAGPAGYYSTCQTMTSIGFHYLQQRNNSGNWYNVWIGHGTNGINYIQVDLYDRSNNRLVQGIVSGYYPDWMYAEIDPNRSSQTGLSDGDYALIRFAPVYYQGYMFGWATGMNYQSPCDTSGNYNNIGWGANWAGGAGPGNLAPQMLQIGGACYGGDGILHYGGVLTINGWVTSYGNYTETLSQGLGNAPATYLRFE